MKRPLVVALLFFIYGMLVEQYFPFSIVPFFMLGFLSMFLIFAKTKYVPIISVVIFMMLGAIAMQNAQVKNAQMLIENSISNSKISGVVLDNYNLESGYSKLIVKSNTTKILVITPESKIKTGNIINFYGKLEPLEIAKNYGAFDEKKFYEIVGVKYKTFPQKVEIVNHKNSLNSLMKQARANSENVLDKVLPKNYSAIMKAMILGNKTYLQEDTKNLFRNAGIYHMLAISGTHISLIGIGILFLFNKVLSNQQLAGGITLFVLVFYCILTGGNVSTVRAVLMISLIILGNIISRNTDILTSTAFACFALLIYQPLYLFNVGFLLSFSAVLSLIFLTEPFEKLLTKIANKSELLHKIYSFQYLNKYFAGVLAVTVGQFGCSTYFFYYYSSYSLLVNFIVIPSLFVVIIFGFLSLFIGFANIAFAKLFSTVVYFFLVIYEKIALFFTQLPYSFLLIGKVSFSTLISIYLLLCSFVYYFSLKPKFVKKLLNKGTISIVLSLTIVLIVIVINKSNKPDLVVYDLSTKKGSYTYISNKTNNIIIDADLTISSKIVQDNYKNTIIPFSNYMGISKINSYIVTKINYSNLEALTYIMDTKNVNILFLPEIDNTSFNDDEIAKIIRYIKNKSLQNNIQVVYLEDNYKFSINPNEYFTVVKNNDNINNSLTLKYDYSNFSLLFVNDAKNCNEICTKIYENKNLISAISLSGKATSEDYINLVNSFSPKIIVIKSEAITKNDSLDEVATSRVYSSEKQGQISIKYNKDKFEISSLLEKEK